MHNREEKKKINKFFGVKLGLGPQTGRQSIPQYLAYIKGLKNNNEKLIHIQPVKAAKKNGRNYHVTYDYEINIFLSHANYTASKLYDAELKISIEAGHLIFQTGKSNSSVFFDATTDRKLATYDQVIRDASSDCKQQEFSLNILKQFKKYCEKQLVEGNTITPTFILDKEGKIDSSNYPSLKIKSSIETIDKRSSKKTEQKKESDFEDRQLISKSMSSLFGQSLLYSEKTHNKRLGDELENTSPTKKLKQKSYNEVRQDKENSTYYRKVVSQSMVEGGQYENFPAPEMYSTSDLFTLYYPSEDIDPFLKLELVVMEEDEKPKLKNK